MESKSKVSSRFPSPDVFFGTSADLPRVVEIDLVKVAPNPDQPRRSVDEEKLRELANSIAEHGLIHPITVRKADADGYMIVAGERRFRAFALLERSTIPAIVTEGGIEELALIENIQREDLSPIDEFEAVARLIKTHGYSQGDAARVLGKSRVSINELLSLGSLTAAILDEARASRVSKSALIEIARAGDEEAQKAVWANIRDGGGTVRAARKVKQEAITGDAEPLSPIGSALRAGKRFAKVVDGLPKDGRFAEIRSATEQLLSLLDAAA